LKIKLDENLGPSVAKVFLDAGHDAILTLEQGLGGQDDSVLIEVCRAEGRCLVTLDLDFGQILRFPPSRYAGIAILRLSAPVSRHDLLEGAATLIQALEKKEIHQKLWIVSKGRVREFWSERES
jgi:predicted nuclease of predicted toxin-antitoxin system